MGHSFRMSESALSAVYIIEIRGVMSRKMAETDWTSPELTAIPERITVRSVTSADGTLIRYDLHPATSPTSTLALVVPGFWRDRRYPTMLRLGSYLEELGYAAAIMDCRGHGESDGTYGFNLSEHEDTFAVAVDALEQGNFTSIVLVGFSVGGAIAISTAARHELPLAGLLLISPVAEFSMIVPRVNPFTIHRHIAISNARRRPRFDWKFAVSPKLKATDDIANVHVPVSLIHVKNDWLIDHTHSLALFERANEPRELHIIDIPGNYHADRIFLQAGDRIEPLVRRFLADRLASVKG